MKFSSLIKKIGNTFRRRDIAPKSPAIVSPKTIGDTMALEVSWESIEPEQSYNGHRLKMEENGRCYFQPKWSVVFSPFILFTVLLYVIFLLGIFRLMGKAGMTSFPVYMLLFILVFFLIHIYRIVKSLTPIIFDHTRGYYWKSWQTSIGIPHKNSCAFHDIHALQIIPHKMSSNDSFHTYYELNIILKNKNRMQVIIHHELDGLIEDATRLGAFLSVPVWNGVQVQPSSSLSSE